MAQYYLIHKFKEKTQIMQNFAKNPSKQIY